MPLEVLLKELLIVLLKVLLEVLLEVMLLKVLLELLFIVLIVEFIKAVLLMADEFAVEVFLRHSDPFKYSSLSMKHNPRMNNS